MDLVLIFNALNNVSDLYFTGVVVQDGNDNIRILENACNLRYTGCMPRTEVIFNSYFLKVVNIWNHLPTHIKYMDEEDTNVKFKKAVMEHYAHKFERGVDTESLCT